MPMREHDPFSDPEAVSRYAEGAARMVPGYHPLLRMAMVLLAERVPEKGRVLVVGAGGGMELKLFAETHSGWRFDGVDPSAEMLQLARQTLGPLASRARLHEGVITDADAPEGPFDAATSLLTLHFLTPQERRSTLAQIHRRLKPGAPFVVAHLSIAQGENERALWLSRYAAFAVASGLEPEKATNARTAIAARLDILSPQEDEAMLHEAGFSNVTPFYIGFTFRGWIAYA